MSNYTETAAIYATTYVMHEEMGNDAERLKVEHDVLWAYGMVGPSEWQRLLEDERRSRELDRLAAERLMASYKD